MKELIKFLSGHKPFCQYRFVTPELRRCTCGRDEAVKQFRFLLWLLMVVKK